jgi:hypothetical protein
LDGKRWRSSRRALAMGAAVVLGGGGAAGAAVALRGGGAGGAYPGGAQPAATHLSPAEYRRQGNAICADVGTSARTYAGHLAELTSSPASRVRADALTRSLLSVAQDGLNRFNDLSPPASYSAPHATLITLRRLQTMVLQETLGMLRDPKDHPALGPILDSLRQRLSKLGRDADTQHRLLGLEACIGESAQDAPTAAARQPL